MCNIQDHLKSLRLILNNIDKISTSPSWSKAVESELSHPELNTSLEDVKHYLTETIIRLEDYLTEVKIDNE